MINTDESAVICDLAETYSIFDYKSLPGINGRDFLCWSEGKFKNKNEKKQACCSF